MQFGVPTVRLSNHLKQGADDYCYCNSQPLEPQEFTHLLDRSGQEGAVLLDPEVPAWRELHTAWPNARTRSTQVIMVMSDID
jgi:hypothetical protein